MDPALALDAARPLLPAAARWLPALVWACGAAVAAAAATYLGLRSAIGPLRKLQDAHWSERARAAHPVASVSRLLTLVPAIAAAVAAAQATGPLSMLPPTGVGALAGVAAYLACFATRRRFARELGRRTGSFWQDLGGEWAGQLLLMPHVLLVLAMLATLRSPLGAAGIFASGLFALAFALLAHSAGLPVLRWLGAARPADAKLEGLVREVGQRLAVHPRAVWIVRWPVANAIAFPLARQLAFTERILETLDEEELAAIIAHELGHLSEPASVKLGRTAGVAALFPLGLARPILGGFGAQGLLVALVGTLLLVLAVARIARAMEKRADAVAHAHQPDEGVYARALEKLYQTNLTPAVMPEKRPVHPHLYDRLLGAGVEPAYPRPSPPSRRRTLLGEVAAVLCLAVLLGGVAAAPYWASGLASDPADAQRLAVALSGGAIGVRELGVLRGRQGALDEGVAWLALETELYAGDHRAPAYAASLLGWAGRCSEAQAWLELAERRGASSDGLHGASAWLTQARQARARCRASG